MSMEERVLYSGPVMVAVAVVVLVGVMAVYAAKRRILLPTRYGDDTASAKLPSTAKRTVHDTSTRKNGLGQGDTYIVPDFLTLHEARDFFVRLQDSREVTYQQWYHMPSKKQRSTNLHRLRRVKLACANPSPEGLIPLYRFPVNNQAQHGITVPMPAAIEQLRQKVEQATGHAYNHAVVLLYKDANECIGFHKDKTLDLDPQAPIISISLGCERPYVLRDNILQPRYEHEWVLPHGSLLALGSTTNEHWYHSVRQLNEVDVALPERRRLDFETSARISVTFRKVTTYMCSDGSIVGQGAAYQTPNWPEELNGCHRIVQVNPEPTQMEDDTLFAEHYEGTEMKDGSEASKDANGVETRAYDLLRVLLQKPTVDALLEAGYPSAAAAEAKRQLLVAMNGELDEKNVDRLVGRALSKRCKELRISQNARTIL